MELESIKYTVSFIFNPNFVSYFRSTQVPWPLLSFQPFLTPLSPLPSLATNPLSVAWIPHVSIFTCGSHTCLSFGQKCSPFQFSPVSYYRPSDIVRCPTITVLHSTSHYSQLVICPFTYTLDLPLNFAFHEGKDQFSHHYNTKIVGIQKVLSEELLMKE